MRVFLIIFAAVSLVAIAIYVAVRRVTGLVPKDNTAVFTQVQEATSPPVNYMLSFAPLWSWATENEADIAPPEVTAGVPAVDPVVVEDNDDMSVPEGFAAWEFREWLPHMNKGLMLKLGWWRQLLIDEGIATGVEISTHPIALGRKDSKYKNSMHYWKPSVRAVDTLPIWVNGGTREEIERAIDLAIQAGFTGIGAGVIWNPRPGLHLDVRPQSRVSTWGYYRGDDGRSRSNMGMAQAIDRFYA